MTQTPTIGRMISVLVDPAGNNGSDTAAAVITRVWSNGLINVRLFRDAGGEVESITSMPLAPDLETALEIRASTTATVQESFANDPENQAKMLAHITVGYWPQPVSEVDQLRTELVRLRAEIHTAPAETAPPVENEQTLMGSQEPAPTGGFLG